jgi:hypothetical protein
LKRKYSDKFGLNSIVTDLGWSGNIENYVYTQSNKIAASAVPMGMVLKKINSCHFDERSL